MLMPKKMKFRKQQKGSYAGTATKGTNLDFGKFGIKTMEPGWITARQIESARRTITRAIKKGGQVFIRIFPDKPVTLKSAEVPMGSGKGAVDHFVAVVKPGRILFELDGVSAELAKKALKLACYKLPVKTKVISKEEE